MSASDSTSNAIPSATPLRVGRLAFYFALVYFLEGICQYSGLIGPTIQNYLRVTLKFDAEQTATFGFWVGFPWMLKPVYGLISDFIPLFGYRRKSYLLLCNMAAATLFLVMSGVTDAKALMIAVAFVGVSVAAADVIVDALMVEFGQKTGLVTRFQSIQWTSIYAAAMLSSILASYLVAWYEPQKAVSVSALICIVMPLIVLCATWWSVPEQRTKLNADALKESSLGLLTAFKSGRLWLVLVFISLHAFNPGMDTPAYYYFTNELKIDVDDVTFSGTYFNVGAMLGSITFMVVPTKRIPMRVLQTIGILVPAAAMIPFCFVTDIKTMGIGNGIWGYGYMIGSLATLSLAAAACPRRAEGVVFATLLAASNLAMNYGNVFGGRWYEGFAAHRLWVMVLISSGITLLGLFLVPFLPKRMEQVPEVASREGDTAPAA